MSRYMQRKIPLKPEELSVLVESNAKKGNEVPIDYSKQVYKRVVRK